MADSSSGDSYNPDTHLTPEEAFRLHRAFQNKEFLELFQNYVEEISSDDSKKEYEKEIIALERERGFDVVFLHPIPAYVLKFVLETKKTFVNICKNEHVGKASSERKESGSEWKIPVILSKPREDLDKKKAKCTVFDVMFHPTTIEQALRDRRFKDIVEDTAISTIGEKFKVYLNAKVVKYPKLYYKGNPPRVVLRRNVHNKIQECEPIEEYWKKTMENELSKIKLPKKLIKPKYNVKYRDIVEMKDFSLMGYTDTCAPKEIIIEIKLPDVQNANDVDLDIFERKLLLKSRDNADHCYILDLNLSYGVDKNNGKAKFDKTTKILHVQLPLKDRGIPKFVM